MRNVFSLLGALFLPFAAEAFYSTSAGRWMSRDPIEEKGGENLYRFCDNAPLNKYDPLGKDIYLFEGNNSWNPVNNRLHQTVAVDVWSDDCPPVRMSIFGFSFCATGAWMWNWPSSMWLGFESVTWPGLVMEGEIYEADAIGRILRRKKTTICQDREWLKTMENKVGTKDVYSVGRHNCRNFSQREFEAAPGKEDVK